MTRRTIDSGDAVSPDGERLHAAFAEEVDRPGLEGPAFDLVLRSGTARLRRRRATVGATFAVASVTAVAAAALAAGGMSHGTASSPAAAGTTTTGTTTTTPAADPAAPAHSDTPTPPPLPPDAVLTGGTLDGHSWQLVRAFTATRVPIPLDGPMPAELWRWCGRLNVVVDGTWTNAGNGDNACLDQEGRQIFPADPSNPGFTSIAIVDSHHDRLGTVVAGRVSSRIGSVTAQCGSQTVTAKASQPAGDTDAYYALTFGKDASCQTGSLSFFQTTGGQVAYFTDVMLVGGK
jgi:hypothetical protein